MSLKLSQLKNWLTLEDAAKHLSLILNETVEAKDLIQISLEGNLTLSLIFPNTVMAVQYKHNESAHEPEPEPEPTVSDKDPNGILKTLELWSRALWAIHRTTDALYEPDFNEVWDVHGLWNLPLLARTTNIEILGAMLKTSLSQQEDAKIVSGQRSPVIVEDSKTGELMGLVKFSDSVSEEGFDEANTRHNYSPENNLPSGSFVVIAQTELQRFADSLNEPQAASPSNRETSNAELHRAQRTLAALAIGLAKNHRPYNNNGKPNASQLAKLATEHLRDADSDRTPHGISETTARQTITEALKAHPELQE